MPLLLQRKNGKWHSFADFDETTLNRTRVSYSMHFANNGMDKVGDAYIIDDSANNPAGVLSTGYFSWIW